MPREGDEGERVDGDATLTRLAEQDGVEVEAGDVRSLNHETCDAEHRVGEGVEVERSLAAHARKERRDAQAAQRRQHFLFRERRQEEGRSGIASTYLPPSPSAITGPKTGSRCAPIINLAPGGRHRGDDDAGGGEAAPVQHRGDVVEAARTLASSRKARRTMPSSLLCATSREQPLTATGPPSARKPARALVGAAARDDARRRERPTRRRGRGSPPRRACAPRRSPRNDGRGGGSPARRRAARAIKP